MPNNKRAAFSKTRYQLADAMIRLLEKKSFRRVSVGDICREAMVSRSGFYVHFADKYALLEYSIDQMLEQKLSYAQADTLDRKILMMLEGVQRNRQMLYNIFMADLDPEVIGTFERMFRRIVEGWLGQLGYMCSDDENTRMTAAFYAGGLANVVICWIRENFATSKEQLALSQSRLLLRLLGAADEKMSEKDKTDDAI